MDSEAKVCQPVVYEGICREYLLPYQNNTAIATEDPVVYIPADHEKLEATAKFLFTYFSFVSFSNSISDNCSAAMPTFLCLQLFGVCTESGEIRMVSSSECKRLTTEVCPKEISRLNENFPKVLEPVVSAQNGIDFLTDCEPLQNHISRKSVIFSFLSYYKT